MPQMHHHMLTVLFPQIAKHDLDKELAVGLRDACVSNGVLDMEQGEALRWTDKYVADNATGPIYFFAVELSDHPC